MSAQIPTLESDLLGTAARPSTFYAPPLPTPPQPYWAVFRPTGGGEIQLYGGTYDAYRARYDELRNDGWRLHLLDIEVIDGEPHYWAVFHMSPMQFRTCDEAVPG